MQSSVRTELPDAAAPPGPSRHRLGWALMALLSTMMFVGLITFVDHPVLDYMAALLRQRPALEQVGREISHFGDSGRYLYPLLGMIVVALLLRLAPLAAHTRQRLTRVIQMMAFLFAAIALTGIATNFLKLLFGRPRPREYLDTGDAWFAPFSFQGHRYESFPSGHATTAFALAAALGFLFPRWRPLFFAAATVVGFGRVLNLSHYPSDVAAGALVGILLTAGIHMYFVRRGWLQTRRDPGLPSSLPEPPGNMPVVALTAPRLEDQRKS